jgi:hypothetical protein
MKPRLVLLLVNATVLAAWFGKLGLFSPNSWSDGHW